MSREEFLCWASTKGVGFDTNYPDYLAFQSAVEHARFWLVSGDAASWPRFISTLLSGLDSWEYGYLWPLPGKWPSSINSQSHNERVRDVLLRGAGIPDGWTGAIRFDRAEDGALVAVLFAAMSFGWCQSDDLFFVPDHARQFIRTDYHDVLHAHCNSEDRVTSIVRHMAGAGYKLPTEVPDWTFIKPDWM